MAVNELDCCCKAGVYLVLGIRRRGSSRWSDDDRQITRNVVGHQRKVSACLRRPCQIRSRTSRRLLSNSSWLIRPSVCIACNERSASCGAGAGSTESIGIDPKAGAGGGRLRAVGVVSSDPLALIDSQNRQGRLTQLRRPVRGIGQPDTRLCGQIRGRRHRCPSPISVTRVANAVAASFRVP